MPPRRYIPLMDFGGGAATCVTLGALLGAEGYRRLVVLKQTVPTGSDDDDVAREALVWESYVGSALSHPNVVHVYELLHDGEGLTLIMEYVPGLSLRTLIDHLGERDGSLPWPVAIRIVADAALGLFHAHHAVTPAGEQLSVVHRDVNPNNLLVTESGFTKVADFGIARHAARPDTVADLVKGTLGYLSPEQACGRNLDWRSDVFSLGVVLYELLTMQPLFRRETVRDTMHAVLRDPVPPLPPQVPALIHDLLKRMLAREPAHRTIDMARVADLLEQAAAAQSGTHQNVSTFIRAEARALLQGRKERVRQLLCGEATGTAAHSDMDASTLLLLETALDTKIREAASPSHEDSDTLVDDPAKVRR